MRPNNYFQLIFFFFSFTAFSQVIEPDMVFVKGGNFQMGCVNQPLKDCASDEKPGVEVQLYDFWIGKYEVTNAQFTEFLTQMGNQQEGGKTWYRIDKYALIQQKENAFVVKEGLENHPVNNISWYGAKAYAKWLSEKTGNRYRLPTEAEWEYAAKGGQQSKGHLHSGANDLEQVGWSYPIATNSKTEWGFGKDQLGTHPVGTKEPNELGIYDMTGNLSEWCSDFYDINYPGGINPKGAKSGSQVVLRGGSWDHGKQNSRVTTRFHSSLISGFSANKGFRLVMEKDIISAINAVAERNDFQGVILAQKGDDIIYHNSFGLANREAKIPNQKKNPFVVASITKMITSTLILQLAEEGKIDLQETIIKYLPNYRGEGGDKVTVHQLLNHTSGIKSTELAAENKEGRLDIFTKRVSTDELLDKYCSEELVNEPGSLFYYNNGDYIILGKIIESVVGDSYENALNKRIFDPLGMKYSGLVTNENANRLTSLAKGYNWNKKDSVFVNDPKMVIQNYYASGAVYSTVEDIAKFANALFLKKTLLNDASMESLLATHPETKEYGYGLWVRFHEYNDDKTIVKVVERYGRIWGINTLVTHIVDHDMIVISFANTNKVNPWSVNNFVHKQFLD